MSGLSENPQDLQSAPVISSVTHTILDSPPSCIEFSPLAPDLFVVGTYSLDTDVPSDKSIGPPIEGEGVNLTVQSRSGSIILLRMEANKLDLLQTCPTCSAVLDLHFSPHRQDIFAVATSTGVVEIYALVLKEQSRVEMLHTVQAFFTSVLVLSLAWHPSPQLPSILAVSVSDGSIAILDYTSSSSTHIQDIDAHSLEAWIVAWSSSIQSLESTLYSGGDDSRFCTIPIDVPALMVVAMRHNSQGSLAEARAISVAKDAKTEDEENVKPPSNVSTQTLSFDTKIHGAGVTAILPIQCPNEPNLETVLTGSYDEYLRVLVPRPNRKWKIAAEQRLGGGVWRLKLLDNESNPSASVQTRLKVLASCMHVGSKVLEVCCRSDLQWTIAVLARFEEHESMNYGSDATRLIDIAHGQSKVTTVVSTSFYDKKLCVWNIPDTRSS